MKISAKAEYACLAVLALARHGLAAPPMRIREISESSAIPERYLVQILLQLKGAGLVVSTRGASGGYSLAPGISHLTGGGPHGDRGARCDVTREHGDEADRLLRAGSGLGEPTGRRTCRPRPHHHRPARRTILSP